MPTWNPLVSKVTLPSGSTYNIKDGYVWDGANQEEIFEYINAWLNGNYGPEDLPGPGGPCLAYALDCFIQQVNGSNQIDGAWTDDDSTPDLISTSTSIIDALRILGTAVEDITGGNAVVFKGVSTTALTDGGNENPTVNGTVVTTKKTGDLYFAPTTEGADTGNVNGSARNEFIYGSDSKWHWLGNQLAELGALAYKSFASASYTPAGTVSQPTFTGAQSTVTISTSNVSSGANYTPAGTVTGGQLSLNTLSSTGTYTPQGTVTSSATKGDASYTSVKWKGNSSSVYSNYGAPTGVSQPTFTGTPATITVNGTPSGTVTQPTFTGTATTITTKGTPGGTVSTPTISVQTAGTTDTVKGINTITQMVSALSTAAPGATAPSNAVTYVSYSNETLILNQLGASKSNPVSTVSKTFKTGDAAYQSSQPTFTGALLSSTASYTPGGTVSQPTFNGTAGSYTGSYTPAGTVSQPNLTRDGQLYYMDYAAPTISSTFAGTPATITVSGTPSGSVTTATFEGQPVKITGTVTPSGTVSQPSFSGTASTITVS